ncbi:MAG: hypothetical protein ACYCXY_04370 [Acidimicrobiales bacterium]
MTRTVASLDATAAPTRARAEEPGVHPTARGARMRSRWLSPRALLLHLEVVLVAPACVGAGWWQATRALAGNGLSWVYSVEWPVFALLAVAGWWHLLHEDPGAYRARKAGSSVAGSEPEGAARPDARVPAVPVPLGLFLPEPVGEGGGIGVGAPRRTLPTSSLTGVGTAPGPTVTVDGTTARLATALAVLVGLDLVLGMATLVVVSPERPTGWVPSRWVALYLLHGLVGLPLAVGAVLLLARVRGATRISRLSGWTGAVGVLVAAAGGLLTVSHPARLAGMALMLLGAVTAGFGYLFPTFEKLGS